MATPKSPKTTRKNVKIDRREALLAAKKKKECNARALKIVEEFIDGATDHVHFLDQLRWINQTHYQDIVEERAIIKICGYPLCCQKLENIPKKQYHIVSSQNKVYDITERKHFCSNHCYKASLYLKNQLGTSPLWLREKEPVPEFTLFQTSVEFNIQDINFGVEPIRPPEEKEEEDDDESESVESIRLHEEKEEENDENELEHFTDCDKILENLCQMGFDIP